MSATRSLTLHSIDSLSQFGLHLCRRRLSCICKTFDNHVSSLSKRCTDSISESDAHILAQSALFREGRQRKRIKRECNLLGSVNNLHHFVNLIHCINFHHSSSSSAAFQIRFPPKSLLPFHTNVCFMRIAYSFCIEFTRLCKYIRLRNLPSSLM